MSRLEYQKQRRKLTSNSDTKKYEKTYKGYLMRKYRNMQSRVTGVQSKKAHLYLGLEILPRDDFYDWALSSDEFYLLFESYKTSEFDRKLAPTVDRIDPKIGYIISNMRWLTHSENSRLTSRNIIKL